MGAGKTTLIDEICKLLRIQEVTSSPTFAIVNEYHTEDDRTIYHIDCYRLDDLAGAYRIGLEEYIDSGEYCFIEWPEVVTPLLDEKALTLYIEIIDDGGRAVSPSTERSYDRQTADRDRSGGDVCPPRAAGPLGRHC